MAGIKNSEVNKRIRQLREELKLSQGEFANVLNLNRNFISLLEVGKRNPSGRTILSICEKFNVNEEWMNSGKGDMFRATEPTVMEQLQKDYNLDGFSYSLVYEYLKLSQSQREAVRNYFYKIMKKTSGLKVMSNVAETGDDFNN